MEPHDRMKLIEGLMEEATQKMGGLAKAMAAQDVSHGESQQAAQGAPAPQEQYTLQAEREWWEKAHYGLTVVHNAFAQIEQSERQRGVIAKGAGA